jgi:hypothetical protein
MHMDDLWFDLAIRGEPDLQGDVVERFHLSDGTEPDRDAQGSAHDVPPQDGATGPREASIIDCG